MEEALVMLVAAMTSSVFLLGMWIRAEVQRRQLEKQLWTMLADQGMASRTGAHQVPAAVAGRRVEQLEAQLDQVVQQIDRLAESQEFLSRVLTDRIDHLPDPRLRTPH